MLLGDRMTGAYTDWRVVEDDLYDIAGRVQEYDPEARLIRQDGTGLLGLARYVDNHYITGKRGLAFAREIVDLRDDTPLAGCPDARVIRFMEATDSRRIRRMRDWYMRTLDAHWRREARAEQEEYERQYEPAERFVHAMRDDVSAKPFAAIGRSV